MGSSAKRKKEKAADFKKAKLKVGKTKPKAGNATDTSFRARAIVVGQQSLTADAPSATSQFSHSLSLLTSKSDSQRRDALASLTNALTAATATATAQPAVTIILKCRPLLIDASRSVRSGALNLLRALPPSEVEAHASDILIYAHIGLTHMAADIRAAALDTLEWLLGTAGEGTVSCTGGWTGSLRRLTSVLGWTTVAAAADNKIKGWTTAARTKIDDVKLRSRQIGALALLLDAGLQTDRRETQALNPAQACCFPLWDLSAHRMPTKPDPYAYLGLFAEPVNATPIEATQDAQNSNAGADGVVLADVEGRAEALKTRFEEGIQRGVAEARKEGGEIGRAARSVERALAGLKKS